jgi:hypothetical protein
MPMSVTHRRMSTGRGPVAMDHGFLHVVDAATGDVLFRQRGLDGAGRLRPGRRQLARE